MKMINYQYTGGEKTERQKLEVVSKFWSKGKWDNFILPFLPDDCRDMTFIEGGCNAGLFLKLAEDKGFRRVIGVESDRGVYEKALAFREENGGKYQLKRRYMELQMSWLPASDYLLLSNTHYYFEIENWVKFLDKLITKTRYCIIVTAGKKIRRHRAPPDTQGLKNSFRHWELVDTLKPIFIGDPLPRDQWSFCFKSPLVERVPIDTVKFSNKLQGDLYRQLDDGVDPKDTIYCKRLLKYKIHKHSKEHLIEFVENDAEIYKSVRDRGLFKPLLINSENVIRDGNHRLAMLKHLGHNSVLVRRI